MMLFGKTLTFGNLVLTLLVVGGLVVLTFVVAIVSGTLEEEYERDQALLKETKQQALNHGVGQSRITGQAGATPEQIIIDEYAFCLNSRIPLYANRWAYVTYDSVNAELEAGRLDLESMASVYAMFWLRKLWRLESNHARPGPCLHRMRI